MPETNDTPVPSPCIDNCCLNDDDVCVGCLRTLQDILVWGEADSDTRREILKRVEERRVGSESNGTKVKPQ